MLNRNHPQTQCSPEIFPCSIPGRVLMKTESQLPYYYFFNKVSQKIILFDLRQFLKTSSTTE